MSPTSISGGGKLLTGGEFISPASCDAELVPVGKDQEELELKLICAAILQQFWNLALQERIVIT